MFMSIGLQLHGVQTGRHELQTNNQHEVIASTPVDSLTRFSGKLVKYQRHTYAAKRQQVKQIHAIEKNSVDEN